MDGVLIISSSSSTAEEMGDIEFEGPGNTSATFDEIILVTLEVSLLAMKMFGVSVVELPFLFILWIFNQHYFPFRTFLCLFFNVIAFIIILYSYPKRLEMNYKHYNIHKNKKKQSLNTD